MNPPDIERTECGCDPLLKVLTSFYDARLQRNFNQGRSTHGGDRFNGTVPAGEQETFTNFHRPTIYRLGGLKRSPKTEEYLLKCTIPQDALRLYLERCLSHRRNERGGASKHLSHDGAFLAMARNFGNLPNRSPPIKLLPFQNHCCVNLQDSSTLDTEIYLKLSLLRADLVRCLLNRSWTWVHEEQKSCGNNQRHQIDIVMSKTEGAEFSWLEYRKLVVAQALARMLKRTGNAVDTNSFTSTRENSNTLLGQDVIYLIGRKVTPQSGESKTEIWENEVVIKLEVGAPSGEGRSDNDSIQECIRERIDCMKDLKAENPFKDHNLLAREGLPDWMCSSRTIALATIHHELLSRPLAAAFRLASNKTVINDAINIMYNYARVISILQKFQAQVDSAQYPKLSSDIDGNLKIDIEEEVEIYQLLLHWFSVIHTGVMFARLEVDVTTIQKFLLALARAFNNFYHKVKVLVPTNAPHLFPMMNDRIHMLRCVRDVFEECLYIMQVKPSVD